MNRGGIRFPFITHLYEKAYNLLCRYPAGRLTQTWVSDILDLPNMLDYDIRNGRTYMYAKFRKDSAAKLMVGASSADIRLKKRVRR